VPYSERLPEWEDEKSVVLILLSLAMICFPFSVAATNLFLGMALAIGLFFKLWWHGLEELWSQNRLLLIFLLLYLAMVPIGMLWSLDTEWGWRILARHWFWLLLPVVVVVCSSDRSRNTFLLATSFGLTANLVFCALQAGGLIESPSVAGSTMENATGHIGHTSFGFIYGIWAAWLLHLSLLYQNKLRWMLQGLALWALAMVFMAQGKSGYIISLLTILLIFFKWLQDAGIRRVLVPLVSTLLLLVLFMAVGPAKDRLFGMSQALTTASQEGLSSNQQNAVSSAAARLEWWKMSYEIWLNKPMMGNGTGSFPKATIAWQEEQIEKQEYAVALVHPHNQYLLVMVRWGGGGLFLLLALLYFWIREGFFLEWSTSVAVPLIALTGGALLVHGLSSSSLEEHFSTIFALILLGVGLSERNQHG